jgi:hypothetical protein
MKAKVIIEKGETTIILTPENEFEIDVIEKVHCKKEKHSINAKFEAKYNYGTYNEHNIELSIKEVSHLKESK